MTAAGRVTAAGRLFDEVAVVDWSAASDRKPRPGPDRIWWAAATAGGASVAPTYAPTRGEAVAMLADVAAERLAAGKRLLIGFDFPFGYPAGVAARAFGEDRAGERRGWRAVWEGLAERLVEDGPANNRFALAAGLNAAWPGRGGPFWGNGGKTDHPGLPRKKPGGYGETLPPEWRIAERWAKRARAAMTGPRIGDPKSVWQLAGAGAVGGQVLTGIPALERLRRAPRLAGACVVWPFETGLSPPKAPICLAEVYPSLRPAAPRPGEVKDAAQVRTLALWLARLDGAGELGPLFAGPPDLTAAERAAVAAEEAWILGLEAAVAAQTSDGEDGDALERDDA